MNINEIDKLKQSIIEADQLVDEMIEFLEAQKIRTQKKEKKISELKEEVRVNIEKIDKIIDGYNANT